MYGSETIYPSPKSAWMFFQTKDNSTLYVDGGGTVAEVMDADIGAKNGVIHIVDKVRADLKRQLLTFP